MQVVGAKWWKFDFHTHTPASFDYGKGNEALRSSITPRDWLMEFVNKGVECVAVTDHNTGKWVDPLKEEAEKLREEGFNIFVFPGVEISANNNIHVLGIFDTDKDSSHIFSVLGSVRFNPDYHGSTDAVASSSLEQVAQIIKEMDGVVIPAHIDCAAGLCVVAKGFTLPQAIQHVNAVEVIRNDSQRDPNNDPIRSFRELGSGLSEVLGSDSHAPDRVGEGYTWVKMSSPSLEGLRLSLHDGKGSVLRGDEHPEDPNNIPENFISSVTVENSKYCGRAKPHVINFHPWMNSIIGGRGSGKSSMLEFLRIGTGRSFEIMSLEDGNEIKSAFSRFAQISKGKDASGVLLDDTTISVNYTKGGQYYKLAWRNNEIDIFRYDDLTQDWDKEEGDVAERFPIRIFSQKQIFDISRSPNTLLTLIDESDSVRKGDLEREIARERSEFFSLRLRQREFFSRIGQKSVFSGRLSDINRKISFIESSGHKKILEQVQRANKDSKKVDSFLNEVEGLVGYLKAQVENVAAPKVDLNDDPERSEYQEKANNLSLEIDNAIESIRSWVSYAEGKAFEFKQWSDSSPLKSSIEKGFSDYQALVASLQEQGVQDLNEYQDLVNKREETQRELANIKALEVENEELNEKIGTSYQRLIGLRKELTKRRLKFIDDNLQGDSSIKVSLNPLLDTTMLESSFREVIGRKDGAFSSDIYNEESEGGILWALNSRLMGCLLIDQMESSFSEVHKFKGEVLNQELQGISGAGVSKRFHDLLCNLTAEQIDSLNCWFPEDELKVSFSVDGRKFKDIAQGSAGQRSATVLTFLLSFGEEPLVLDQPEDDLDNKLIYDLVVKKVKKNKSSRQVIVVTHNPNIVVNGDSELVICLHEAGGQINLQSSGSLQEAAVRKSVCDIMEGGRSALEQRYRRIVNLS
ncbi:TrlF family AAA-like ATPase [Halomonas ramblicola]|uniref:TrlF family AAA-like ATPase n=1 Tax=Halomonas ramblicola TaxID=747349 RepID=UPI0025B54753|nr:PHP-associated domain-containing protein [Halomonas ramblicola]MDN3523327.1 PHP-associated domain-containing protein [Halomonas ramblicola]